MQVVSENNNNATSTCFSLFIGGNTEHTTHLLTDNISLLSSANEDCMDTCSFYSGPSEATIFAFGESSETAGTLADGSSSEAAGTLAFSGSCESAGTVASSVSSGTSSSCACSYSC